MICVCSPPQVRLALLLALVTLLPSLAPAAEPRPTPTPAPAPAPAGPPRVLTSFLPVFSLTRQIAGQRASVENWLPQGVDPHEFQFQPRDLRRLRDADLLIVAGLGLEPWKESQLRTASGNPRLRILEALPKLPPGFEIPAGGRGATHNHAGEADHDHDHDHDHDRTQERGPNPHYWLDPVLTTFAVTNLTEALIAADPAGRETYQSNARAAVERLAALHREFATALAPHRQAAFVSYHDAFPYLAKRYELRRVGVVESNAAEEPSAREIAELAATVRREKARVLFVDGRPSRLARRLAADLGLEIAILETLETGPLETGAYEAGMRRNLKSLLDAFGRSPERSTK